MEGCETKAAEVVLHSSIAASDVDFYVYTKTSFTPSNSPTVGFVSLKHTSNLGTWTQGTNPCTNVKIYSSTLPSDAFDTIFANGGINAVMGIGLAYKGAKLTFITTSSNTITAQDGLFVGVSLLYIYMC